MSPLISVFISCIPLDTADVYHRQWIYRRQNSTINNLIDISMKEHHTTVEEDSQTFEREPRWRQLNLHKFGIFEQKMLKE